jgi:glycosyltransferase involved in cell wall biosynthesis
MNKKQNKNTVSVIYLVGGQYNNELFKKSLKSTDWAYEIVRVETESIEGSFSEWRNEGLKKSTGDWILYIDTDEIVTPELKKTILECVISNKYSAYAIPRRNIIFGRNMKHCGLWPDYVLRLIKKSKIKEWKGELHEQPVIEGEIFHLDEPLIHYKHDNLNEMVDKTNKWSEVEAKLMYEAHHPPMNFLRFFSAGLREFWLRMVIQTAFLDGSYGVIYAIYQVYSRLISYSKLWELQIKHASGNTQAS